MVPPIETPSPVDMSVDTRSAHKEPEVGTALCLSGGGYRAMLFHVGSLWRLYDTDLLSSVQRISSVSGGSITAAVLGMNWAKLSFDAGKLHSDFVPHVVEPIRAMARKTIDVQSVLLGLVTPGRISQRIAKSYDKVLYKGATLQSLPDTPRFVINATNLQSGVLWRFMKPYMRDYLVGEVVSPTISLADAVAASSAFPPVLSPMEMRLDPNSFTAGSGLALQRSPFTERVILADGGVYDNLGLETAWKRYRTILVSDAGGKLGAEERPKGDWARQSYRILSVIDNQVRSLRKRALIDSYRQGAREGAYWGIRTDISKYGLADAWPCPVDRTTELAEVATRLKETPEELQERLINWGYAVTDAALRQHVVKSLSKPDALPYPAAGI